MRLASDFSGSGTPNAVYEYMGTAATGANLDLASQDYTNLAFWKQVPATDLIPQGVNVDASNATAVGGIVVLNDVRGSAKAYIDQATVNAGTGLAVKALENATIHATVDSTANASGGSAFGEGKSIAVNATIATNLVLSAADATVTNSFVSTATGSMDILGHNTSSIVAVNSSDTTSSDTGVGITLAFNTIGWKSQNFLFNAVDVLLGDPAIAEAFGNQSPAEVQAYIVDSTVDAGGPLTLSAISDAHLSSTITNTATSAVSSFAKASTVAIGGVLASNMVNSVAKAYIQYTGARESVGAGGDVTITAQDNAGIDATATVDVESSSSNNLGASILASTLATMATDYQFTTMSGVQDLHSGDMVRLDDSYAGGGTAGKIYLFTGTDTQGAGLNLGTADYSNPALWELVTTGDLLTELANLGINFTPSDSMAIGGLVVRNDVRSDVEASVLNVALGAAGNITVNAVENAGILATDQSTVSSDGNSALGGGTLGGGTSLAVNGVIATNTVLSSGVDTVSGSSLTTTAGGAVDIEASNTSTIDASVTNTTSADGPAVGVTLAFNTIGITPQNFLFNTVDALFGTNIANEQPAETEALVSGSTINAAGPITVNADSTAQITAYVESSAKATDTSFEKSQAVSVGATVALNKVSTTVQASIDGATSVTAASGRRANHLE